MKIYGHGYLAEEVNAVIADVFEKHNEICHCNIHYISFTATIDMMDIINNIVCKAKASGYLNILDDDLGEYTKYVYENGNVTKYDGIDFVFYPRTDVEKEIVISLRQMEQKINREE